VYQKVHNK
jgi:hypothetical protein